MATGYVVTNQKQDTQINPVGTGFVNVWDITVKSTAGPSKGSGFILTVPEDDHNATYVQQAIEEKLATLNDVASLGDNSTGG